jgi:hypothetical protein
MNDNRRAYCGADDCSRLPIDYHDRALEQDRRLFELNASSVAKFAVRSRSWSC